VTVIDVSELQSRLRRFAADRNWGRFHTTKNLAMALSVEVAELVEIYQWLTPEQADTATSDQAVAAALGEEMADILLYLVQLADVADIDLVAAVEDKLEKNEVKHPPA